MQINKRYLVEQLLDLLDELHIDAGRFRKRLLIALENCATSKQIVREVLEVALLAGGMVAVGPTTDDQFQGRAPL